MNYLLGSITTIITFYIGYRMGRGDLPDVATPVISGDNIKRTFKRLNPFKDKTVGAVSRPTGTDIYYRDNPTAKEEDDEMGKMLERVVNNP